ncbi:MAG: hypothetical protein MJ107_07500, partial [Lachnospiraceae bacterium]|nr:hypothetical protein [Lachnospiraceae bacterium]
GTMYRMHYDLIYIDDDEVPELVYMEDNYHAATVHLCLAYEDGVYEVGEFGQYGMFSFVPKKGKICSFFMGMGTYLSDYYTLENRTLQEEKYFEMSEDINDNSKSIYYIDGDEVDADTYNKETEAISNQGFVTCDYYAAFSYEDSYDVLKILTEYATTGIKPHAIEITDEIKNLESSYHAIKYGPEGNEIKDINILEGSQAGMYGGLSFDSNALVSIWYGNEDKSFADYAMPISKYMDALSIVETGGIFGIRCLSEDTFREYLIYSMPDGTIKLEIYDSRMTFDAGKVTFILERDTEE